MLRSELKNYEQDVAVDLRFTANRVKLLINEGDIAQFKGWSIFPRSDPCSVSSRIIIVYVIFSFVFLYCIAEIIAGQIIDA